MVINLSSAQSGILKSVKAGVVIEMLHGGRFRQGNVYIDSVDVSTIANMQLIEFVRETGCVRIGFFRETQKH